MTPPRWALAFLACAGFVLAACSSTPSTPKHATTTTHKAAPTTTSSTTTSTTASTTTTTSAPSTACNHITASPGQSQGAAGTIAGVITVTNTGPSACTANGYPKIALFSGSAAPITVTMVNGLSVTLSPPANAASVHGRGGAVVHGAVRLPVLRRADRHGDELPHLADGRRHHARRHDVLADVRVGHRPCNNGTIRVSPVYAPS